MIHHSNVPTNIRYRVYREAYSTATMLYGLKFFEIDRKQATKYNQFCVSNSVFATKIRGWGEAGVMNTRSWYTPKISDRGRVCMVLG